MEYSLPSGYQSSRQLDQESKLFTSTYAGQIKQIFFLFVSGFPNNVNVEQTVGAEISDSDAQICFTQKLFSSRSIFKLKIKYPQIYSFATRTGKNY